MSLLHLKMHSSNLHRLAWDLGVLNELIVSPVTEWWRGLSKEEFEKDTAIDYYHNQIGIEEATKSSGKEAPLYEIVRRTAKEGKFRY